MKKLFLILVLLFSIPSQADTLFGVESTPEVAIPAKISLSLMGAGGASFIGAIAIAASMPIAEAWTPIVSGTLIVGATMTITGIAIGAAAGFVAEIEN